MAELNAYLMFKGNCRDAMDFYKRCLGGDLNLMTAGDSPMAAQTPPEMRDKIMHSALTSGGVMLMGSDMFEAGEYVQGNTLSLCLVCQSKEEIERLFSALSEGGHVTSPLKQEFFGWYGALTDRYGFSWMFQFGEGQKP